VDVYDINVTHWEEMVKNDKKTIVYVIKYMLEGIPLKTMRSYSEFYRIFKKIYKVAPNEDLPKFPEKKTITELFDEVTLGHRRLIFDKFLKAVIEKKLITKHLIDFLAPLEEIPYFGSTKPQNQRKSEKLSPRTTTAPSPQEDPLGTHQRLSPNNKRDSSSTDSTKNTISLDATAIKDQVDSFMKDSTFRPTSFRESTKQLNRSSITNNIIANYANRVSQNPTNKEKDVEYNVSIPTTFTSDDNNEPKTYYEIVVKNIDTNEIITVKRRYREFRTLHDELREYAKHNGLQIPIPELPNKGNLGTLTSKFDPKVIEYRKMSLRSYLQLLLRDRAIANIPCLVTFLNLNYSSKRINV